MTTTPETGKPRNHRLCCRLSEAMDGRGLLSVFRLQMTLFHSIIIAFACGHVRGCYSDWRAGAVP